MSSTTPRVTLRPPPHRSFLNAGYPGIAASDPSVTKPIKPDPLFSLPVLLRPAACLSGTVEVRLPSSTKGVSKARWLRVELEKIESVPSPPSADSGGKGGDAEPKKREAKYVELIGSGPGTLWEAGKGKGNMVKDGEEDEGRSVAVAVAAENSPRKAGRFKSMVKKGGGADEEDEDGWESITEGNYVFSIPLPEGLPPTTEVDSRGNGISYQLVATLCGRGKKGLLKSASKPALFLDQASVLLLKADILPTWPVYSPLLPLPLPPKLPWVNESGPTVGETKEAQLAVKGGEGNGGEVWMKATRESGAYGPGDAVQVRVQIGWGGDRASKLTRLDFVLRETLTFRHPIPERPGHTQRGTPRITSIFTANASVSTDPENPTAFAVLYPHEPVAFNLTGIVPNSHSRVTVRTAKYVDVAYHLKIRAMLEGGDELAVDHWPVIVGNVGRRESNGLMSDIGYVEVLCDRPGGDEPSSPSSRAPAPAVPRIRSTSPDLPLSASIMSIPSPQPVASNAYAPRFANLDTTHTISAATPPPHPPRSDSYDHLDREPTQQHTPQRLPVGGADPYAQFGNQAPSQRQPSPTPPCPTPQTTFHTSPTAAEEKARLHEEAIRIREERQARRVADEEQQAKRAEFLRAQSQLESPTSPSTGVERDSLDTFIGHAEGEKASLQSAALVRRQLVQDGLAKPPVESLTDVTAVAQGRLGTTNIARSNTTVAWNGSAVGEAGGPSPSASPAPNVVNGTSSPLHQQQQHGLQPRELHPLLRSKTILSHAEAEKRRIYQEAVERARVRQEEARLELERQSAALAEFESAELERLQREVDEEQAMLEEEERRRAAALLARDEFERGERERVARLQAEWEREERERQRKAREEFEERMRAQEERRVAELARLAEQHREYEEESKAEMLRKRQQRDEEEIARRAELERLRVEREEREVAARRVAEEERAREEQAREEAERRRLEENKRRAYEERLAEEDARRRWEEEQALEHARRAHAQAAGEHRRAAEEAQRRAAEEAQRRAQEEEAARAAAAIAAEGQRGLQLYDAPVPRNDHPIAGPRAQQPSGQGFDSNHYLPPQGYGQYQSNEHYSGGPTISNGHSSSRNQLQPQPAYPRPSGPSALARSPSVNSFAPTTALSDADVNFYATAIANSASPNPSLSEEKAAYIRRLREADEARKAGLPPPSLSHSYRQHQHQPLPLATAPLGASQHGHEQTSTYAGYPQSDHGHDTEPRRDYQQQAPQQLRATPAHAYPQPAAPSPIESSVAASHWNPAPIGRSHSQNGHQQHHNHQQQQQQWSPYPPSEVGSSAVGAPPPSSIASTTPVPISSAAHGVSLNAVGSSNGGGYRSAREEKDEEEARRKEQDRVQLAAQRPGAVAASAPPPEEDMMDGLPSYPAGSSSAPTQTAAEEKTALKAYNSAKAAVDAQQQAARAPPPLPPSRLGTLSPRQPQYPLHSINEGSTDSSRPSSPAPSSLGRPQRRDIDSGSEGSSDVHRDRDLSVAAGKRPVPISRSVSGSTMQETAYPSSAPPPLPPQQYGYEQGGTAPPPPSDNYSYQ